MIELLFLKYSSMHRILLVSTWLRRNSIGPVNTSFTGKSVSAEDFSSCFFIDLRILFSTLGSISWRHQRFSSSCYKMSFCQQKWSRAVVRRGISAFFFNRGTKKENLACMAGCMYKREAPWGKMYYITGCFIKGYFLGSQHARRISDGDEVSGDSFK